MIFFTPLFTNEDTETQMLSNYIKVMTGQSQDSQKASWPSEAIVLKMVTYLYRRQLPH